MVSTTADVNFVLFWNHCISCFVVGVFEYVWLHACLRNYEQQQQAKALLGTASVHARDRVRPPCTDRGAGGFAALERSPAFSATPIVTESLGTMARGTQPADEAVVMKEHWPKDKRLG